ncbi:MAG TPA: nucleotidyltransferase family protein [Candidatus Sulfotelmatobacter sp.]|jgi:mannose-1-phosphate guanylyltransferase|nr:nucleotidyltransferase family protein [Candidatus Sulfotelmatobacter sp.]
MTIPKSAVILSGGEGLRLRPITHDVPKGLVKVGGKPLLEWVVEWLQQNRVTDLVIGVAYLKEKIMRYFGNGGRLGVDIRYSVHTVEGGTSEGFRLAISRYVYAPHFFALNGDQIADLRLRRMYENYQASACLASIAVVHPRLPFGLVDVNQKGLCRDFVEKPVLKDVFISTGVYVFDRKVLNYLPRRGDVERTTFPKLAKMNKLKAFKHGGSFITVNSLRELEEADEALKERRSR